MLSKMMSKRSQIAPSEFGGLAEAADEAFEKRPRITGCTDCGLAVRYIRWPALLQLRAAGQHRAPQQAVSCGLDETFNDGTNVVTVSLVQPGAEGSGEVCAQEACGTTVRVIFVRDDGEPVTIEPQLHFWGVESRG